MNLIPTSEGTLLSSIHGRDRRSLRSIGKKDLLAAKKYGRKERTYGYQRQPRWKFTFADIVYITEDDEVTEVTSYVLPVDIPMVQLSLTDYNSHRLLTKKLHEMPSICTSHIVVVIDQSASMKTCDVDNYKTRSDAVFGTLALDYIAKQIDNRKFSNANYTDAVTLIEMNDEATIVFGREPCTNVLFNKVVERKQTVNPRGHGMYRKTLDTVGSVMLPDRGNDSCTLVLLFLSDGVPSDFIVDPWYCAGQHMSELCRQFGPQLSVYTLGFAKRGSDFTVLQTMVQSAKDSGCASAFTFVDTSGNGLSTTIANLSDTMSATRRLGTIMNGSERPRTMRRVDVEPDRGEFYQFCDDHDNIKDGTWSLYKEGFNRFVWDKYKQSLIAVGDGDGIAIRNLKLGVGAERIVFRLVELKKDSTSGEFIPTGDRLVAKECKFEEDLTTDQFHAIFCKTQRQASKLADKFNTRISQVCSLHGIAIPAVVNFLPCSVIEVPELFTEGFRTLLVEKRLDPSKYAKWNSNNGYVAGPQKLVDILNRQLLEPQAAPHHDLYVLMEKEEDSDCDDEMSEDSHTKLSEHRSEKLSNSNAWSITSDDIPQAFSHYTYRYTQRSQLVCDLQGVLDDSVTPPVFQLTDPVIHAHNPFWKKHLFGRTDHGHKGMRTFMNSHSCNDLCRLLGLQHIM